MPTGLSEAREPVTYLSTDTVTSNGTTGWSDSLETYTSIIQLQTQVFNAWTGTGSSVTSSTNGWPEGWIDTGTCAGTTTNTVTFTGNTAAANGIWGLTNWQDSQHSKVRWTPSVYRGTPKTPEEIANDAARAEQRRQQRIRDGARRTRFKEAASGRARGLLMQMLNREQKRELEKDNHFHLTVHSQDGSMKVYRIDYGYAGNVKLLGTDGKVDSSYCIHSDSRLPYEDQMLAQKLLLEANEPEFLRIANRTIRRRRAA